MTLNSYSIVPISTRDIIPLTYGGSYDGVVKETHHSKL